MSGRLVDTVQRRAAAARAWAADAIPLTVGLKESARARPVGIYVTAGKDILHASVLERLGGEVEDVAEALEDAVMLSANAVGVLPAQVRVRHPSLARALAPRFEPRGIRTSARRHLPGLDDAARAMLGEMAGQDIFPAYSAPRMWAAWGFRRRAIGALFAAAAGCYRAAPWRDMPDDMLLDARMPAGREWTLRVMGRAGRGCGVTLGSNAEDVRRLFHGSEEVTEVFATLRGHVMALVYLKAETWPPEMQREAAAAGWEIAGPDAHPKLVVMNTPGGGLPRADLADLVALLGTIPRYAAAFAANARVSAEHWRDPEHGIRIAALRDTSARTHDGAEGA